MTKGDPLILIPVAGTFGSLFAIVAIRSWRRYFLFHRAPLQPISAASSSEVVAVEGRIVAASAATVTAPLSGVAAVYYRTEMRRPSGKIAHVTEEKVPFEIEDGSGARASVSLDAVGGTVLGSEGKWTHGSAARLELVRRGVSDATATGPMRYSEEVLQLGQMVFVVGPARRVGGGSDEYRFGSVRLGIGAAANSREPLAVAAQSRAALLRETIRDAWVCSVAAIFCALAGALVAFARC